MNLQEITANIRLRNPWEAIDLGFAMVQQWWKSIYPPLAIITFGLATLIYLFTPTDYLWVASLIFWWLKPLYDRVVLHVVSRRLFNQDLNTWQVFKALPLLIWNTGFFQSLTFRRFSLSRGFNLSIWQLEQLRGSKRATRQKLLHKISHTHAAWLTIGLVLLEIILWVSLFGLLYLFLPEKTAQNFVTSLFGNDVEAETWVSVLDYFFYIAVVTLVHPFYIAASFSLYINRRTQLEAWDIELDFRKLSIRLSNLAKNSLGTIFISVFILASLNMHVPAYADTSNSAETQKAKKEITEILDKQRQAAEKSKEVIRETMRIKELNDRKKVKYWVPKKQAKSNKSNDQLESFLEPFAKIMGFIIEFGLWLLIAIGLILLIYFRDSWLQFFKRNKEPEIEEYQAPEVMFGMDVRPDSLPDDIVTEARKLWQENKPREALSLLYRGALIKLINQEQTKLQNSHTENDVLRVAKKTLNQSKHSYLTDLTSLWKQIAYAHRKPDEDQVFRLLDSWDSEFASLNSSGATDE